MKFLSFLEEKIFYILFHLFSLFIIVVFLKTLRVPMLMILFIIMIQIGYLGLYLGIDYYRKKKKGSEIIGLVDHLKEKYLIAEILPKGQTIENEAYRYAIKKACKAMNDKLGELEQEKLEYQEYVESFAHEIKTPISVLSLAFDNTNNGELKEEIRKIELLVEQMIYYARSQAVEKDYFIKELSLEEVVHSVILNYKEYLIKRKIVLNIHDLNQIVYTDLKWLLFILSQVIQNSIKYLDKKVKKIEIYSEKRPHNIVLVVKDNGCGMKEADRLRVFEKGFTGSNRKKEHSTGMGLYLSKKLCKQMGIKIEIDSKEGEYTKVELTFPKGNIYQMEES